MITNKDDNFHFDVSTGLKSVLGSELITDDEVAIFELVKNSFDAEAKNVYLFFGSNQIIIADDGTGMSYDDIKKKWLFVAYSTKRNATRKNTFRDDIVERSRYAGSKGIGRFSSDRLGQIVTLQTRSLSDTTGPVHCLQVDWNLFDINHQNHFEKIGLTYSSQRKGFTQPSEIPKLSHGTVITIERTRRNWDRDSIIALKASMSKLINPFGSTTDDFQIVVFAPAELEMDNACKVESLKTGRVLPNQLANGPVGNFIFSTLREKTTFIDVFINSTGNRIETTLVDRGELIYRIQEPNPYHLLLECDFKCQLYFLNQSAKLTFHRRMGVPSVQFGSVFLFRNGFRVVPIGNEGDDWFGMDRRKQQGYARFLGTRDVIGRIDVAGFDDQFEEPSSRNTGLIETPAVIQLRKCFREHCLKRLERYVVPVTFVDKEDKNMNDISRLLTDPGRARVASVVADLVDHKEINLLEYSKRLIGILDERSSQFEKSLISLRAIAEKTQDVTLYNGIVEAEKRFEQLKRSEEEARRQADEERKAKEKAQTRAAEAERAMGIVVERLDEEKKRNLFLSSIAALDTEIILNMHHQVTIYAVDIQQLIENFIVKMSGHNIKQPEIMNALEKITFLNRKIMGISKFATRANFRLESEKIESVLGDYIEQYVNDIARDFLLGRINVVVENDHKGFKQRFKPIDISIVIDNLIANARKARASKIIISIKHPSKNSIHILVQDNGRGLSPIIENPDRIFEKGFSTTDGSGLGLFHVRQVLGEMNGTIEIVNSDNLKGMKFLIRIAK